MPAPTYNVPTSGTDPKIATLENHEAAVQEVVDELYDQIVGLVDSPEFTGTPTAPTPTAGNNSTALATTEFVGQALEQSSEGVTQTIGDGGVLAGTAPGDGNYVLNDPAALASRVTAINLYAIETGSLRVKVWSKVDDAFTQISSHDITITSTGAQTLTSSDFTPFDIPVGAYLGIYSNGIVSRSGSGGNGIFNGGGDINTTSFTDSASQDNIVFQISFDCVSTLAKRTASEVSDLSDLVSKASIVSDDLRPSRWVGIQGVENFSSTYSFGSIARTIIPAQVVPFDGTVSQVDLVAVASGGTAVVRVMDLVGTTFTQVASASFIVPSVGAITLVGGGVDFDALPVKKGQWLAFDNPAGCVAQTNGVTGFDVWLGDAGLTTITDSATQNNIQYDLAMMVTATESHTVENHGGITGRDTVRITTPAQGVITGDHAYGQSWLDQNGTTATSEVVKSVHYATNALMLKSGLKLSTGDAPAGDYFMPLYEDEATPSILGPMSLRLIHDARRRGINRVNVARQRGLGGQSIENLTYPASVYANEGVERYDEFIGDFTRLSEAAAVIGCTYEASTITWIQGNANAGQAYQDYKDRLIDLIDQVQIDVMAATGQRQRPYFVIAQPPGAANENLQAQVDIANEREDVILGLATWAIPQHDNIHFNGDGCIQVGEILAIVRQALDDGRGWSAPFFRNAKRTGTTITLDVGGDHSVIADETVDTPEHYVPDGGAGTEPVANLGFTYSGANITSVLVEPRKITITLDADAAGRLGFAFTDTDYGDGHSENRGSIRADWEVQSAFADEKSLTLWAASGYWDV